jgi:chromosome segregation ATPase
VEQAQLELQLKIWKELAISKQILMRTATDALKLDQNCTQDQLKEALDAAIKKIGESDSNVITAREQAKQAVAAAEKKMTAATVALATAEATVAELQTAQENTLKQMAGERAAVAKELQTLKDRVAERDKSIKAINTALADTPDNIVRKMKALRKEKQDEADARREVEATVSSLRKDKKQQDQQVAETLEKTVKLTTQYREVHTLCVTLHDQLKTTATDASTLPAVPELDSKLLEEIEQASTKLKK